MLHEPFGPRGAEDERDTFWTDLGEVTDAAYREEPEADTASRRTVAMNHAKHGPRNQPDPLQAVPPMPPEEELSSHQDPLGSWTGVPSENQYETPTQDADDL